MGLIAVLAILIFLFWPGDTSDQIANAAQPEYPEIWNRLALPQLPNGKITKVVDNKNPKNGIVFEMKANQPIGEIGSYYEKEFDERDFDFFEPQESSDCGYSNGFNSGDTDVSIDVRPDPNDPGSSKVRIVIRNKPRNKTRVNQASLQLD